MIAYLPPDKLGQARSLLENWQKRSSCKLKELQSLIGVVQFACRDCPGTYVSSSHDRFNMWGKTALPFCSIKLRVL